MTADVRRRPDDHVIVLFGATGDLAKRKLCRALQPPLRRSRSRALPLCSVCRGPVALSPTTSFGSAPASPSRTVEMRGAVRRRLGAFRRQLFFAASDVSDPSPLVDSCPPGRGRDRWCSAPSLPPGDSTIGLPRRRGHARRVGLGRARAGHRREAVRHGSRLCAGAQCAVHAVFTEADIFRIDHFLGRSPSRTSLRCGLRTACSSRSGTATMSTTYRSTFPRAHRGRSCRLLRADRGVPRHDRHPPLQVLGFIAMEPPTSLNEKAVRDETSKVFDSMKRRSTRPGRAWSVRRLSERGGCRRGIRDRDVRRARGRDRQLALGGRSVLPPYRQGSRGEQPGDHACLPRAAAAHVSARRDDASADARPNELVIDFKDPGSISAFFLAKEPGPEVHLREVAMTFSYESAFAKRELEGYERLVHDAMLGDQALFTRATASNGCGGGIAADRAPARASRLSTGLVGAGCCGGAHRAAAVAPARGRTRTVEMSERRGTRW